LEIMPISKKNYPILSNQLTMAYKLKFKGMNGVLED